MKYKEASHQKDRKYDACHYLLTLSDDLKSQDGYYLNFKVHKKSEMNVYIYEGLDRVSATKKMISDNGQVEVGTKYQVKGDSGILVIAFPNKDQDTSFSFSYIASKDPLVVK